MLLPPAEFIEAFARYVPGAIYIYRRFPDGSACLDYISDGIADIYGYTPTELYADVELGHDRILPQDRLRFDATVRDCFETLEPWKCEYRVELPDRGVRHVSAAATLERQEDGSVIWIGHLIDVTEFAVARDRLQEEITRAHREAVAANEGKSNFIAHVSHELRTPLHGIMGLSELISGDREAPEHVRRQATEIHNAGNHLLKLIGDIIDLSAIEAGRLALSLEAVSLAAIVDEVVRMATPIARERGITIDVDEHLRDDARVWADWTRLVQVLLNLVANGIKYNRAQGRVALRLLAASDEAVRVGIEDTGPGLSADEITRLYDSFNRLGRELGTIEGSGIGLVIAKNLMAEMNGAMGVESQPGVGSTFWIELPSTNAPTGRARALGRETKELGKTWAPLELKVLVAEDNSLSREVFSSQLRKLGCEVEVVENGDLAWHAWRKSAHEVVITDVHMPGVSGFELTQRIRAGEVGIEDRKTYIIGASANAMKEAFRDAITKGMDDYVTKPLSLDELRLALTRAQRMEAGASRRIDNERGDVNPGATGMKGTTPCAEKPDHMHTGTPPPRASDGTTLAVASLNLEFIEELANGDSGQLEELLSLFLESAESCIDELVESTLPDDGLMAEHAVHKLKSSARTVGANRLGDLCELAESAAGQSDWQAVESARREILTEFMDVRAAIEARNAC
ncbi:MAG: ATP-binding protein [Gammaproteobacteria bacterium]